MSLEILMSLILNIGINTSLAFFLFHAPFVAFSMPVPRYLIPILLL